MESNLLKLLCSLTSNISLDTKHEKDKGKQEQLCPNSFSLCHCDNNTEKAVCLQQHSYNDPEMSMRESMMSVRVLHVSDN